MQGSAGLTARAATAAAREDLTHFSLLGRHPRYMSYESKDMLNAKFHQHALFTHEQTSHKLTLATHPNGGGEEKEPV